MTHSFVIPHGQQALLNCLAELPTDKKYLVTIDEAKRKRSLGINSYYWGYVVNPIADFCGSSPERTHEDLLGDYFGWKLVEFRGHRREVPRRTTTTDENGKEDVLTPEKMRLYVHHCESVAADMGVPVSFDSMNSEVA